MKKNSMWVAIPLMMVTVITASCSSSDDEKKSEQTIRPVELPTTLELTRSEQEMVGNGNDFAFNLFREARDKTQSQILSPISITYALGMLNNGAAGETQKQINQVLGYSETGAKGINDFCYKMMQKAATLDDQTKVLIANNIYLNQDYQLLPDFVNAAKAFYDASPETRNFNDGQTCDVINQWTSDHTEGMIKEVLKKDEFDSDAVSYLLNAIYFKGMWQQKFDKNTTKDDLFKHPGTTNEALTKPMMNQISELEYMETDDYQALRLPYGNGAWQMTILLPKVTDDNEIKTGADIDKVLTSLTAASWQQIQQQLKPVSVNVRLPRFESDTNIDLVPIMKKLGMTKAFDEQLADFPYFCNMPTYIKLMKQVAKIKLDEEGTEAAAVTVIGMVKNAPSKPNYITFHANHPFLYIISEQSSDAIFFIGQYTGY
jgi:serpin B